MTNESTSETPGPGGSDQRERRGREPPATGSGPATGLVPVRWREVAGRVVLTNPWGDFAILEPGEMQSLRAAAPLPEGLRARLAERNFVRDRLDEAALAERARRKTRFLEHGPNLHILVVTLRCNQTCVYCHASRAPMDRTDADMSPETAERAVDLALSSTSPSVTIEFQGGEPLANFAVVRRAIDHAIERNRVHGKALDFTLVSNLSLLDDEKLEYLLDRRVQICTSVDGPRALHDGHRRLPGGSAFDETARAIARVNAAYEKMGLDPSLYHVEALLTTTRESLAHPREIVDTYVALGCRALFLRPVDPFGFAARAQGRVAVDRAAYVRFYREAVDHAIDLGKAGTQVLERYAAIFLTKILDDGEPNFLDIRSPCGAGIGQVAYNWDGSVYTCDEGRMLADSGDRFFQIGRVGESKYRDLVRHETVRALALASNLDAQPGCASCAWRPYCGVCPVQSYAAQGTIHGRMRDSAWCATHMGILDYLFEKIATADPETMAVLRRWTTARDRTHYVHTGVAS